MRYCPFIFKTERFKTREVMVGNVGVGGNNPIRIQSMTTTDTREVQKTAEQIMRLADAGCEIVRVTVQGMKEAYSCEEIKSILIKKGYKTPLVADIHFFPKAALTVADFVDKVRINPGNYADKRASFQILEYTESSYQEELNRLEEKFTPLVEKCKKLGIALRIGTNHGSLSDRIMNRYGDSPLGMVESALEFARVCRKMDYHNFVFSMKASNTHIMIHAYRLLAMRMQEMGWDYPLHLGVTEAGIGEDGRIKSAVGIGALLLDGLGDTIRVSLTEDPWHEVDPCKRLINLAYEYNHYQITKPFIEKKRNPLVYHKRLENIAPPFHPNGSVIVEITESDLMSDSLFQDLGFEIIEGKPVKGQAAADGVYLCGLIQSAKSIALLKVLQELEVAIFSDINSDLATHSLVNISSKIEGWKNQIKEPVDLIILSLNQDKVHVAREIVEYCKQEQIQTPIVLKGEYGCSKEDLCIHMGAEMGALLCDGLAEGFLLSHPYLSLNEKRTLSFQLLQACRLRSFKTEFISCPSCGRTLFDLQEVTRRIQERTAHLPGVKIAVMGCIVNGPGEMADADFGYVGSKPGKIDLYVGKEKVEQDIDHDLAVDKLIELLKKHNRWIEPKEEIALT